MESLSWSNPEFQAEFLGSYGFDGPREPSVSTAEQQVLQSILVPMEDGQLTEAARRLREAIVPHSSAALDYTLGNIYLQIGDVALAEKAYQQALVKQPGFVRASRNYGMMLAQDGRYTEAIPLLREAIIRGDNSPGTLGTLAFCHYQDGDFAAALQGYEQAVFLNPESADWQLGRAQCLMQLSRAAEALAVVDRYLRYHPDHVEARRVAVNASVAMLNWELAAAQLEILRRQDKADAQALLQLGRVYIALGLPGRATQSFLEAMGLEQKPPVLQLLDAAELLAQEGNVDEAESLLPVVYQQYGQALSGEALSQLLRLQGRLKLSSGETEVAVRLLAEASQRDPLSGPTLLLLGTAQLELGELVEAQITLERATRLDEVAADAWLVLARLHVSQNQWPAAVEALRQAQLIRPEDRVARYLESVKRIAAGQP